MSTKIKFMTVDDSKLSRLLIRNIVEREYPDWEFYEAECGEDAIKYVDSIELDAITVDLNMPGMDGFTLIKKIRPKCLHTHITILSANIQEATQKKAAIADVQFITKPVTQDKLMPFFKRVEENYQKAHPSTSVE